MKKSDCTEEQIEFLRANVKGNSYPTLTKLYNEKFGTNYERKTIRRRCEKYGLSNGKSERKPRSQEELDFLRENSKGRNYNYLAEMFNARFGTTHSGELINSICQRHGFLNEIPSLFEEGHKINCGRRFATRYMPEGSEKISTDGYILVKKDDIWKTMQSVIWEDANGPIPENHFVVFGDGDNRNFNLNNLFCIPREHAMMRSRLKLQGNSPELAQLGIALAGLKSVLKSRTEKK
jgi:hypothetical protein